MNRQFGPRSVLLILGALAGSWIVGAGPARAVDTAFWKPYAAETATYLLWHGDAPNWCAVEGMAAAGPGEPLGDAAAEPDGKFGAALRVDGHGALKLAPTRIFPGGFLAIEAWIKLRRYPPREAYVACRPAVVDRDPRYDPEKDVTKGFALLVDAHGGLHLETTNCFYGRTIRTSSPAGVVPLGRWVHVAGTSATHPVCFRRLYVDGREVQSRPVAWGEGLVVGSDEERKPGPIYVGAGPRLECGLEGRIDELRIHTRIVKFWERDDAWTAGSQQRPLADGRAWFVHAPVAYFPLDGDIRDAAGRLPGLKVQASGGQFQPGVRGSGHSGPLRLTAPKLLDLREGSVEFWLRPQGVNNYADNNHVFFSGPFTLYFVNDGGGPGLKPFTLYFRTPAGIHFVRDALQTEFHPGAWYHVAVTWKGPTIAMYLNGRLAGKTFERSLVTAENRGLCGQAQFLSRDSADVVDEIRLYDRALVPEEVANACFRYRDPARMVAGVRQPSVGLAAQFFPSLNAVDYQCTPNEPIAAGTKLRLTLSDGQGRETAREEIPFSAEEQRWVLAPLADGQYTLGAALVDAAGLVRPGETLKLMRHHFPWEGNRLGITDQVYPPFEPIRVQGREVSVVERRYAMNGFGLWDRVLSQGRELLAGPIRLRVQTGRGEGVWKTSSGWISQRPKSAVYAADAVSAAIAVHTCSTIEIDGCMKVEMELQPGAAPEAIRKLWIEIPLRDAEAPLMHAIGDGLRHNYSGRTPAGEGPVWDGSRAARDGPWRNCFTPYVWLGAEQRGLAWFGENDKGWVTEKQHSRTPTHELVRQADRLTLRVYLINRPVTLDGPRWLRFGLQASPTKPLPLDWRRRLPDIPGGLAVVPFGGLQCASQGPWGDDWLSVEKILQCRGGAPLDQAWLAQYVRDRRPPLVHGTWAWAESVKHFAGRARDIGPSRPLTVYQEEMAAAATRPEYVVFQDEWNAESGAHERVEIDPAQIGRGQQSVGPPVLVTFGPSYRDFGCWFANEWLRRGVSLYWDNTYPHLSTNVRTSEAYLAEDGEIQPALILWNQREYQQRVWNLLQAWRRRRPEPLEWVLHMTNTLVLPLHTWGTADLDHELNRDDPFPPDWLRTETIGRQIGNLPLSLYAVAGSKNRVLARRAETTARAEAAALRERIEWGLRVVHEIQHHGPLDQWLQEFGYGTPGVRVHNYWEPAPVLSVRPDTVKWIAMENPATRSLLLVLACWSPEEVTAELAPNRSALSGDLLRGRVTDVESGQRLTPDTAGRTSVRLPAPYGVRILRWQAE